MKMAHRHFSLIFVGVLILIQFAQAQPDPDVCTPGPGDTGGKSLPVLPEQYKAVIQSEVSGEYNYTVAMTEFYDDINNLGAVWLRYQGQTPPEILNGNYKVYYDYADKQYYTVFQNETDFGQQVCETGELTNKTNSPFGFNNGHIQSAKNIFKFGEEYNETYMGQIVIDGQNMDWWSTCMYDEKQNTTSKIDFFFLETESKQTLPYRIVINGTGPIHQNITDDTERQWFYMVYQFGSVNIGPQPHEEFLPPIGVMCPGRVSGKELPMVPPWFRLNVEVIHPLKKTITYSKEYYHFSSKLVAYQEVITRVGKPHHVIHEVHDYNTGIAYRMTPEGVCHINPIPVVANDAVSKDREHVNLRPPANFFAIHAIDVDWVYEGVTRTRNILVDVWQTYRTHWRPARYHARDDVYVNSTWLYSFALDDWTIQGGETSDKRPKRKLPMQLEIEWAAHDLTDDGLIDTGKEIHNFYQPDESIFEPIVYDTSLCFTHLNESLHLAFNLEGQDTYKKYVLNNSAQFYHGAIESISDSIDVSPTRIANLKVVDGYQDLATVFFTLLGRPQVEGDAINATDPGPVLGTAYQVLQLLVNNKNGAKLTLEFIYRDMEVKKVNAATNTLREETEPLTTTKHVGLSTGVVSGISVSTFILGVVIALLIVFIVSKHRNTGVPYHLQDEG